MDNGIRKQNKDWIENRTIKLRGKKRTSKQKEKILKTSFKKGQSAWNKGIKGNKSHLFGRKFSEESLQKMRGEKSHLWKGGITSKNDKIRTSLEVRLWKKICLQRDNFTCQKTGQKGGKLTVHHINNFADFPELRTSINNGVTLSWEAHLEFHKIYGKKNNTQEQLLEYLSTGFYASLK